MQTTDLGHGISLKNLCMYYLFVHKKPSSGLLIQKVDRTKFFFFGFFFATVFLSKTLKMWTRPRDANSTALVMMTWHKKWLKFMQNIRVYRALDKWK